MNEGALGLKPDMVGTVLRAVHLPKSCVQNPQSVVWQQQRVHVEIGVPWAAQVILLLAGYCCIREMSVGGMRWDGVGEGGLVDWLGASQILPAERAASARCCVHLPFDLKQPCFEGRCRQGRSRAL